jgi:dTDP-4-dehydrorhamnose reductase
MRILLLGANGQVGWELQRSLMPLGQLKSCDRYTANLEDLAGLQKIIREYEPNIIVNAAAYTSVDKAESEKKKAYCINYEAVAFLAEESKNINAWLIHYSSDYIFDGKKIGAYTEFDEPNPLSVYGMSKLKGEKSIIKSGCKYMIFRTSWVYSTRGNNFVKTMIRLGKEQSNMRIVSDQIGAPTSAELIADISAICLRNALYDKCSKKNKSGIYHLSPKGKTSWYCLAKHIIEELTKVGDTFCVNLEDIYPINTAEYPVLAKRPHNSLLETQKIQSMFNVYLPHWKIVLSKTLQDIYPHKI